MANTDRRERELEGVELAEAIGTQINRAYTLIRRPLLALDVSVARVRILGYINDFGPQRIKDLAFADQVSQPTVTAMVGSMEELGWVTKKTDPSDGRAVVVHITAKGRRLLHERRGIRARVLAERIAAMSAADQKEMRRLLRGLDTLVNNLRE